MSQWGTISTGNQGLTIQTTMGSVPSTPEGLVVTRAVETKAGWVGQILVDKQIVWESSVKDSEHSDPKRAALEDANSQVVDKLRGLFA